MDAVETRNYVICTTARSGSNLFCNYLTNTRRLGRPGELLNPDSVRASRFGRDIAPGSPVSMEAYFAWLRQTFTTPKGVFGIKVLYEDFDNFKGFRQIQDYFASAKIYVLRRRSKLRQAISYYFAEQTGQWVATDAASMAIEDVPFDFARIEQHLRRLCLQDMAWITHLEAARLPYTEVIFEDFLKAPADHLAAIARDLGMDPEGMPVEATLKEQANARSAQFAAQFADAFRAHAFTPHGAVCYKGLSFVA